jgi:PKHD-type hydroxylase
MYKNIKRLLELPEAERLASFIRSQPLRQDDDQIPGAIGTWYSLPCCNTLLGLMCERVSKETGRTLLPTYTYCRIYTEGNELLPHRDRPSCEWSVTINLAQSDPWPIYMDGKEIVQEVGDGAIYQGCEVYHWRKPFKGKEHIQVFLHYVDANGPHKDHVYDSGDKGVFTEPELIYKFMRVNPNLHEWYNFPAGFLPEECDAIIRRFKNQDLMKASVGDGRNGVVDANIRRSDVFWISKNKQNDWIYSRIINLVSEANSKFFNFDLTEISEKLQFTRYNIGDKYDWHIDFGGKDFQSLRKLSLVVQLSDPCEYEGGELQFGSSTDDKIEIAPKNKGAVIIFPSYMRHRATEVTKGSRYSLVLWVTGPPFR